MLNIALATTTLLAIASATPAPLLQARFADSYKFYTGDGSAKAGWPSTNAWGSFDQLWNANLPLMRRSCGFNNWGADNSAAEIDGIKNAINSVSGQTGVDKRFILAIVMQESKGCVRVPTTVSPDGRVHNPGLMQTHNGSGSCEKRNPCPNSEITQMIKDGAAGTSSGDGLQQTLAKAKKDTGDGSSRMYYAGARIYNSGSATYSNLNDGRKATNCYSNDVANRLTGWTNAQSQCRA